MRALTLVADRKLELADLPAPATPASGEVQIKIRAVALNHLDLWGYRGMAFARRKLPLVVGAEAAGEIAAIGPDIVAFKPGDRVVMYGALTCGTCKACREGRDNLCENVGGIMGFHIDGFARDLVNMPARLTIPVPKGISLRDAAWAPFARSPRRKASTWCSSMSARRPSTARCFASSAAGGSSLAARPRDRRRRS